MADGYGPNMHRISLRCQGNVGPARVVKLSTLGDFSVVQCTASTNEVPFGISQEWNKGAAGSPFASDYAGVAGDSIEVYGPCSIATAAVKRSAPSIQASNSVGSDAAPRPAPLPACRARGP